MKLHLDNNIIEGTPEELVECLRLAKEVENSEKSLFHFGHEHQQTEDDKEEEVDNSVYDKGAFYTVTEEASESALPVGVILQHQHGRIFNDSQGKLCIVSRPSFLDRGSTYELDDAIKQHSFELAKQLGIQLTSTTDFAVEAEGKYFKVTEPYTHLSVGDIVTIASDTKDGQSQCKDRHGNFNYVLLRDLELLEDDEEEEEFDAENYSIFSPEAQAPSTDLQVGDKIKVLESESGAVREATVTKVLENGSVELVGKSDNGMCATSWAKNVSNLEKVEEDEQEEIKGYTFWYLDDVKFNKFVVLKTTIDGYFETSKGMRYTYQSVIDLIKPIDRADVREEFERAKDERVLLNYYPVIDSFMDSY